MNDKIGKLGL